MKLNTFNDDIPESVAKPASEWEAMVQQHWDHVSKPLDSMGKFEKIFVCNRRYIYRKNGIRSNIVNKEKLFISRKFY